MQNDNKICIARCYSPCTNFVTV